MTIASKTAETVKNFRSTLEVAVAIIGCILYLQLWWKDTVVSRDDFLIATTEIRIGQVEHEIGMYQRAGLDNLTDGEKHKYELLIKAQERLDAKRSELLGLP